MLENDETFNDDSLGSSFASSFSLPSPPPRSVKKAEEEPVVATQAEEAAGLPTPAPVSTSVTETPLETEVTGKTLDDHLQEWRAESSVARNKSESTRLRIEEERLKAKQAAEKKLKDNAKALKAAKEEKELEERIKAELLAGTSEAKGKAKKAKGKLREAQEEKDEKRWANVRDAWEIVKDGSETPEVTGEKVGEEVEVDGRDMVEGDGTGKTSTAGVEMLKKIHDITVGTLHISEETTPTASSSDAIPAISVVEEDQTTRRTKISQAWGQSSRQGPPPASSTQAPEPSYVNKALGPTPPPGISSSGLSPGDLSAPTPARKSKKDPNAPPSQPPSLTLSLFTTPSRRTVLRIVAVLGINLVLPFFNGIMLGFGEIFARETVAFGKKWWRGEATFRSTFASGNGGPGASVAGVGLRDGARRSDALSGSGGFP